MSQEDNTIDMSGSRRSIRSLIKKGYTVHFVILWITLIVGTTFVKSVILLIMSGDLSTYPFLVIFDYLVLSQIGSLFVLTLMIQIVTGYVPSFALGPSWNDRNPWRILFQGVIFSSVVSSQLYAYNWIVIISLSFSCSFYIVGDLLALHLRGSISRRDLKTAPWYSHETNMLSESSLTHSFTILIFVVLVTLIDAYLFLRINPFSQYDGIRTLFLLIGIISGWMASLILIRTQGHSTDLLRTTFVFSLVTSIMLLILSFHYTSVVTILFVVVPTFILVSTKIQPMVKWIMRADSLLVKVYLKTVVRVVFIVILGVLIPGFFSSLPKMYWAFFGLREPQEFSFFYRPEPPPLLQIANTPHLVTWVFLVAIVELAILRRSLGSWTSYSSSRVQQSFIAKAQTRHEPLQTMLYAIFSTYLFALPLVSDEDLMGAPFLVFISLIFALQLILRGTRLYDNTITPISRNMTMELSQSGHRLQLFISVIALPIIFLFIYFLPTQMFYLYQYGLGFFVASSLFSLLFISLVTLVILSISLLGFEMLIGNIGISPVVPRVLMDVCIFLAVGDFFRPYAHFYSLPLFESYIPVIFLTILVFNFITYQQSKSTFSLWLEPKRWKLRPSIGSHLLVAIFIPLLVGASWYTGNVITSISNPTGDVRIAVIDDGINKINPLLESHVISEKSFVTVENGYQSNIEETKSSDGHGTCVATTVLNTFPRASIINAKVFGSIDWSQRTTKTGITEAIRWCVEEQDADVINLSLGSRSYSEIDPTIQWATEQGTLVVCAAGNDQEGLEASINMPAASFSALSVAAMNPEGSFFDFSSWGPTNGTMKPEIAAPGYASESTFVRGTSMAAPRVAGAAGRLIEVCLENNWTWNPAMLQAFLMSGSDYSMVDEYKIGCGVLDISRSIRLMEQAPVVNCTPYTMYAFPMHLPLEIDQIFTGTPYRFDIKVVSSVPVQCFTRAEGEGNESVLVQSNFVINGITRLPLEILVPDNSSQINYDLHVVLETLDHDYAEIDLEFEVLKPRARIAIDTYHARTFLKDIYSDYREYYSWLSSVLISTTELRGPDDFDVDFLRLFDAVVIPSANPDNTEFADYQLSSLKTYFEDGGGLYIDPCFTSMNTTPLNLAFNWTGVLFDFNSSRVNANVSSTHPITYGVDPDFQQGIVLHSNASYTSLLYSGDTSRTVLSCWDSSGRIVISGIANALENNPELWKRITWWLSRII